MGFGGHGGFHGHSHDHGDENGEHHHDLDHEHSKKTCSCSKTLRLSTMLTLTFSFFLVELIVGHITHSLTLVADSFHMLSDVIALCIGLFAVRVSGLFLFINQLTADKNFFNLLFLVFEKKIIKKYIRLG